MKKYLFKFHGTVVLNATSYDEAENLIESLNVNDYVIDEDLFETDLAEKNRENNPCLS